MAIFTRGFTPDHSSEQATAKQLFFDNIHLFLQHKQDILNCKDYFFVELPFCFASWPYLTGDGPLYLGYLLLGWQNGILTEPCPSCQGTLLITYFDGSPLTGWNRYFGYCKLCHQTSGATSAEAVLLLHQRMRFTSALRRAFPRRITQWEEYDGYQFSFAGNGFEPAKKKRQIIIELATPVDFQIFIDELKSGNIRQSNFPNVSVLNRSIELNLSTSSSTEVHFSQPQ